MDFKPQSFFIGIVDFFSVWMPGAILTWFLTVRFYDPYPSIQEFLQLPAHPAARVALFLVITYIAGSILFGISSLLDPLYDKKLRKLFMPKDRECLDLEVKTATAIKEQFIHSDAWIETLYQQGKLSRQQYRKISGKESRAIINTYKWVQHYFLFKYPDALQDIKKLEADSKFFRSLVLTFLIMSVTLFATGYPVPGAILLALSLMSLYLYSTNRYKATIRAYKLMTTWYHLEPSVEKSNTDKPLSTALHTPLEKNFAAKNEKRISSLMAGSANPAKQITINEGEWSNTFFSATADEQWYCMEGKGIMIENNANGQSRHFLLPNAMIPVKKGMQYSLQNLQKEPMEILVFKN